MQAVGQDSHMGTQALVALLGLNLNERAGALARLHDTLFGPLSTARI